MTAKVSIKNLADVLGGFNVTEARLDEAVGYAIQMTGLAVESQARKNASGRPGPNARSGNLRRHITAQKAKKGFNGSYEVEVQATMVYSRAVELGRADWPPGVKYPYLGPAARDLQANGTLSRVFTLNLAARLRG